MNDGSPAEVFCLLPGFAIKRGSTMNNELWKGWDGCHDLPDQQKRLATARTAACTPVSVDHAAASAIFQGKRGRYTTTLSGCGCEDFRRRSLPCKHIYRLALELGVIPGPFSSYRNGGYTWQQVVELVEQYSEAVQEEFLYHFDNARRVATPYRRKKNPEMDVLISAGILDEVADKETPKFRTVRMSEDFLAGKRKVSWYFTRKLYPPTELDVHGDMVPATLPEDDVTALLRQRGFVQ